MPPTNTGPKLMLLGLGTSCPDATPVPDSDIGRAASEALLHNEIVPLTVLALVGEKTIVNFVLWPAEMVNGSVGALTENCEVLARALLIVSDAVPVFVAVTVSEVVLPTTTLPKPRVALRKVRSPIEAVCWLERLPALKP